MEILENHSLLPLNTFHLDVAARYYAEAGSEEALHAILQEPSLSGQIKLVLGGGSNILFTQDYPGLVIRNTFRGIRVAEEDSRFAFVQSGAGEAWHDLVLFCIGLNLGGIENLSLIPGSAGAGPIQNIGAYGVELKDVFHELTAIDLKNGEPAVFSNTECRFGYRNSIFKNECRNRYIITSVTLKLSKNPVLNTAYGAIEDELRRMQVKDKTIQAVSEAVCNIRRSKLPDPAVLGNCGSFFKNPEVDREQFLALKQTSPTLPGYDTVPGKVKLAAGWLIEQCGWKGKQVGHTGSHKDQALVLVNYGGATGKEVVELAGSIRQSVKDKFGVDIEPEVNII